MFVFELFRSDCFTLEMMLYGFDDILFDPWVSFGCVGLYGAAVHINSCRCLLGFPAVFSLYRYTVKNMQDFLVYSSKYRYIWKTARNTGIP